MPTGSRLASHVVTGRLLTTARPLRCAAVGGGRASLDAAGHSPYTSGLPAATRVAVWPAAATCDPSGATWPLCCLPPPPMPACRLAPLSRLVAVDAPHRIAPPLAALPSRPWEAQTQRRRALVARPSTHTQPALAARAAAATHGPCGARRACLHPTSSRRAATAPTHPVSHSRALPPRTAARLASASVAALARMQTRPVSSASPHRTPACVCAAAARASNVDQRRMECG